MNLWPQKSGKIRVKTEESIDSPVVFEMVMRMVHKTTGQKKFPIIGSVTVENSGEWYEINLSIIRTSTEAFVGAPMAEWELTFYPQTLAETLEYIGWVEKFVT